MQRPTGVTIIAVLDFIGAASLLILGLLAFAGGSLIAGFINAAAAQSGTAGAAPASGLAAGIGIFIGADFPCVRHLRDFRGHRAAQAEELGASYNHRPVRARSARLAAQPHCGVSWRWNDYRSPCWRITFGLSGTCSSPT